MADERNALLSQMIERGIEAELQELGQRMKMLQGLLSEQKTNGHKAPEMSVTAEDPTTLSAPKKRGRPRKIHMSAEARKAIGDAQRRRWAKVRKQAKQDDARA